MTSSLTDIGKIESFPMQARVGPHWKVRDLPYSKQKKEGQRDIYYKGQICVSAVIEHWLAMEFDFYGDVYKSCADSLNVILASFGVDLKVVDDNICYGPKWKNLAKSKDFVILRRVP